MRTFNSLNDDDKRCGDELRTLVQEASADVDESERRVTTKLL